MSLPGKVSTSPGNALSCKQRVDIEFMAMAGGVQGGKLERVPAAGVAREPGEGREAIGRGLGVRGRDTTLPRHAPFSHPPLRIHHGPLLLRPALCGLQPALPVVRHCAPGHAPHGLRGLAYPLLISHSGLQYVLRDN